MTKYILFIAIFTYSVNSCSQSKDSLLCHKWSLVKTEDPYQGGTVNERDSSNWKIIEFLENGNYNESDPWNKVEGKWQLNEEEGKLGIKEMVRNEKTLTEDSSVTDFRWTIIELDKENCILGIQGRHGIVKHYYKKAP